MNSFEITFTFEHKRYEADVTIINGTDHVQYTVSPKDEYLLEEYATQVFHAFSGKRLQAAFPGSTEAMRVFTESVAKGLAHFLEKERL